MYDRLTCKTCKLEYVCKEGSIPGTNSCLDYKHTTSGRFFFFLCENCLRETNVGKYYTKNGKCYNCGDANDGNYVTVEDIKNADKLGLDSAGVGWRGVLPAFNVAEPGTVCPVCGYNTISRTKREHMEGTARYNCNDCGSPLRIINKGYEPIIDTEDELKQWVERHKIILRVGDQFRAFGRAVTLCGDRKTVFFVDNYNKVVGRMLTASTCKSYARAISKVVIDHMLSSWGDECRWRVR